MLLSALLLQHNFTWVCGHIYLCCCHVYLFAVGLVVYTTAFASRPCPLYASTQSCHRTWNLVKSQARSMDQNEYSLHMHIKDVVYWQKLLCTEQDRQQRGTHNNNTERYGHIPK